MMRSFSFFLPLQNNYTRIPWQTWIRTGFVFNLVPLLTRRNSNMVFSFLHYSVQGESRHLIDHFVRWEYLRMCSFVYFLSIESINENEELSRKIRSKSNHLRFDRIERYSFRSNAAIKEHQYFYTSFLTETVIVKYRRFSMVSSRRWLNLVLVREIIQSAFMATGKHGLTLSIISKFNHW